MKGFLELEVDDTDNGTRSIAFGQNTLRSELVGRHQLAPVSFVSSALLIIFIFMLDEDIKVFWYLQIIQISKD